VTNRTPALLALISALAILIILGWRLVDQRAMPPSHWIDKAAPTVALQNLDGGQFGQAWQGELFLLHFFASWCSVCRAEASSLQELQQLDIPIYGIAYKDNVERLKDYLGEINPYRQIGLDPDGVAALDYGISGVPESFLVDAGGIIRWHYRGAINPTIIQAELLPLVRQWR